MDRLTIRLPSEPTYIPDEDAIYLSDEFGAKCWQGEAIDRLAAYEDAEEQGRLAIFPCKYGDEIYHIFGGAVVSATVRRITLSKIDCYMVEVLGGRCFHDDKLNKEWFVTREAAEVALSKAE